MNRTSRLSNVFFAFLGAASVGLVIAVLAVAGVFNRTERVVTSASTGGSAPSAVAQPNATAGSVSAIYQKVSPGVAFIEAKSGGGGANPLDPTGGGGQEASGSGFLIDTKGRVVTNDHVVEGAGSYTIRFGSDGKALPAKLLGKDASTDLAVLQVDPGAVPKTAKPLELASSESLRPGDTAIAIGSPFGLSGTVTTGIISALDREIESPNGFPISGVLQTDAAINPGNSGGPLLDGKGRVIGVNSQIASSSRQSSGVGFAVPVDTVKQVAPQLIGGGDIKRAYIGVSTTADPTASGAVVAALTAGGPAADSGLQTGDRITSIDDTQVSDPNALSTAVLGHKPGDTVKLKVERNGQQRTIEVQLGTRPDQVAQQG
jgi:putative serine protease PepD